MDGDHDELVVAEEEVDSPTLVPEAISEVVPDTEMETLPKDPGSESVLTFDLFNFII